MNAPHCMGGWCEWRSHCAHHNTPPGPDLSDGRLCPPKTHDAYIAINLHKVQEQPQPAKEPA